MSDKVEYMKVTHLDDTDRVHLETISKDDIKKKFNIMICKECLLNLFDDKGCETCKHFSVSKHEHPCNVCIHLKRSCFYE